MLSYAAVKEVERLLDKGITQRQIAKKTGISRGSVGRIANHTRPDYREEEGPAGLPSKCPICHCLVYLPCLACKTKRYIERKRKMREGK